jgi:hypothetical protein
MIDSVSRELSVAVSMGTLTLRPGHSAVCAKQQRAMYRSDVSERKTAARRLYYVGGPLFLAPSHGSQNGGT